MTIITVLFLFINNVTIWVRDSLLFSMCILNVFFIVLLEHVRYIKEHSMYLLYLVGKLILYFETRCLLCGSGGPMGVSKQLCPKFETLLVEWENLTPHFFVTRARKIM